MPEIRPGSKILVRTAFDELLERRAVTGVIMGHDFEVVRVCAEEEWDTATAEGREPESTPWPAEDVQLAAGSAPSDVNRELPTRSADEAAT